MWVLAGVAACGAAVLGGCSSGRHTAGPLMCGGTRTAAGVPVTIEVTKGSVTCPQAMQVETRYAALIKSGDVRGTGGGAPVPVGNGWTCQGYATPQILATGDASQCHTAASTILAVLPTPTPSRTL